MPFDPPTASIATAGGRGRFWRGLLLLALFLAAVQVLHPHDFLPDLGRARARLRVDRPGRSGALYVPAALTAVPLAVLTFTAGWLFGPVAAFLVAVPAGTLGACAAFGAGRLMAGDPRFLARGEGRVARLARKLRTRRGFWAVVLLRLPPIAPFALLNFAFGATPSASRPIALATLLGSIPATLGFAIAGAMLGGR